MAATADTKWMRSGKCRDYPADMFFPTDGKGVILAQQICSTCSVRRTCLEFALAERIDEGVWGGTTEHERLRLLRQRAEGASKQMAPGGAQSPPGPDPGG